jgi:hypothetical protein
MKWSQPLLAVLLIGGLAACAGRIQGDRAVPAQAVVVQSPEEALRAQATKFWEARVKGDVVTQYDLQEPKAKEGLTLTGFALARGTVTFLTYKITEVETDGDEGRVTLETTFRLNYPKMGRFGPWDQAVFMRWVRIDGMWLVKVSQDDAGKPLKAAEGQPQE